MTSRILMAVLLAAGPISAVPDDARARPAIEPADRDAPPEVACIALVLPSLRGMDGETTALAGPVRELAASFLTGPSLRTVSLDARLPQHAADEARQKDCDRVLTVTLTRKRAGGFGRALGQAAGAAAWHLPYGSTAGYAAARAGAAAASTIASNTKAKDELRLDYRLSTSGTTLLESSEHDKARTDGEDLVTPLIERMAAALVPLATK